MWLTGMQLANDTPQPNRLSTVEIDVQKDRFGDPFFVLSPLAQRNNGALRETTVIKHFRREAGCDFISRFGVSHGCPHR